MQNSSQNQILYGMQGLSVEYVQLSAYSKYIKSDMIKQLLSFLQLIRDFNVKLSE